MSELAQISRDRTTLVQKKGTQQSALTIYTNSV